MNNPDSSTDLEFEHVASIDSMNAALMRCPWGAGPGPARALLADVQSAGRGRQGRLWCTVPNDSIALSVAVERPLENLSWSGLPLALGVTVVAVLRAYGVQPSLKWPNDLYVRQDAGWAKAGGLLVDMRRRGGVQRLVVGCGLNLQRAPNLDALTAAHSAAEAAKSEAVDAVPPGSLFAVGRAPDRLVLAQTLARALVQTVHDFAAHGLTLWRARWVELDVLAGRWITVHHMDGRCDSGWACGIDDQGALCLQTPDGAMQRVHSAEVRVRGV